MRRTRDMLIQRFMGFLAPWQRSVEFFHIEPGDIEFEHLRAVP